MPFLILALVAYLTGCSAIDTSALHDERFTQGCAVVNASYTGTYLQGNVDACKLVCSENLPDNYSYEYTTNFCKVKIGK